MLSCHKFYHMLPPRFMRLHIWMSPHPIAHLTPIPPAKAYACVCSLLFSYEFEQQPNANWRKLEHHPSRRIPTDHIWQTNRHTTHTRCGELLHRVTSTGTTGEMRRMYDTMYTVAYCLYISRISECVSHELRECYVSCYDLDAKIPKNTSRKTNTAQKHTHENVTVKYERWFSNVSTCAAWIVWCAENDPSADDECQLVTARAQGGERAARSRDQVDLVIFYCLERDMYKACLWRSHNKSIKRLTKPWHTEATGSRDGFSSLHSPVSQYCACH